MKAWVSEHQGMFPRAGKQVKGALSTSVRDNILNCGHTVVREYFSIINRELNHCLLDHYALEAKESSFIKPDNPSLNRNKYLQDLSRIIFVLIVGLQ